MSLRLLAFSEGGLRLAEAIGARLGGDACRCGGSVTLDGWTREGFSSGDAMVFVGAAGIAVRAIAPYLQGKTVDPAVVVVDECGRFAISLVSGHLGGANDLARQVAAACGAIPVITTATDCRGLFSVDAWARVQGLAVWNPERIRTVSAKLLRGEIVTYRCPWPICGTPPEGVKPAGDGPADITVSVRVEDAPSLYLIPRTVVVGIGCKRGISQEAVEALYQDVLRQNRLPEAALGCAASIDLKGEEAGLLAFCEAHGLPLKTFSGEELQALPGEFTPSPFVLTVTGTDNVCERSAALCSGGPVIQKKISREGVTMALAAGVPALDWRWQNV